MADEKTKLEQFFENQASAALWDVAVSLKRGNALPLDANSVFESEAKAQAYCNGGGPAYPGQIIAIVEETGTQICYLDKDLAICPVGVIPTGDDKTIEVTAAGAISLLGAAGAANGTLPMIGDDGKLTWKTLEDIGAGDGNDNTTYAFSFADEKITITPSLNGVAQTAIELDLSTFVTASELSDVVGKAAEGETAATGLYKAIADALQEAKTYADDNDANDNTEYHLEYDSEKKEIKLVAGANADSMIIDATPFIKDGMLENVEYNAENNTLTFTWNTASGLTTDEVVLSDIIEPYTAGDGLNLVSNVFSVKVDSETEEFLTVGTNGVKLSGVQTAIDAAKSEAATDATNKADAAKQAAIDDAATKYVTKEYVGTIPNDAEGNPEATNVIAYVNKKAQEVLDSATGGSSESAASVKQQLDTYKAANDPKVAALLTEVWGSETYTGDSRIDALEAVGAQANVIESVVAATDAKITATKSDKTVTIDDSALRTDIAAAKKAGDDAAATAGVNANAISGHDSRIGALETAKTTHDGQIKALQDADVTVNGKIQTLETAVNNETSGLAATYAKATQNATDIATLTAKDKTHDDDIAALKTSTGNNATAITNLQTAVGNVYTKTESDGKFATIASVGAPDEGKTVVQMIKDLAAAAYDDTEVRGLIADIYTPAEGEAAASGVLVNEISRVEGLVSAEKTRAEAAEKKNADDIAAINALLNTVDSEDNITSLKELASWVEEHGSEASEMAKSITANTEAIAAINNAETGILALAKSHSDANLATAKKYADDSIAALLVKNVDNKTLQLDENGVASVKAVSTDLLIQGESELVFCAGDAAGYHTTH